MRIGCWNLAGRWSDGHRDLVEAMDCDVVLLTEVSDRARPPGYSVHRGSLSMAPQRRWAAVASRLPMRPMPDPHGASAMAEIGGIRVCSSILPWRSCGDQPPWEGATTAERTATAVAAVEAVAPGVWGGDWNHALSGREWSGARAGRQAILGVADRLGLRVATATAPHQIDGLLSIDHIAVPRAWDVCAVRRHRALAGSSRLSDHDAYSIDVSPM